MNGRVSWWNDEAGQWAPAERNRPLTGGDRIATAADGRVELRVGSTVLRLGNSSELEVLRLDDERLVFQLHTGTLALRVRSREVAGEIELITPEVRLSPLRAGHYRLDRIDDTTFAGSWRGELRIDDAGGRVVATGEYVELYRESRRNRPGELRSARAELPGDGFQSWVLAEDGRDERTASSRFVSPEMTGAEDLDRYGRWDEHPEYGPIWSPLEVRAGWTPYRHGRWSWVRPWGWTWIDEAPWGFAPSHYGRWLPWRNGWGWVPGAYVARPVYAPALVAWLGDIRIGGGFNVHSGGPQVGWVPLAPRDVYRPRHRHSPVYVERVNPTPPYRWRHPPSQVPTGPVMYGNQGVPNAVTVVPSDVLRRQTPVAGGADSRPPGFRQSPPEWQEPERRGGGGFDRRSDAPFEGRGELPAAPVDGRGARDGREGRDGRDPREQRDGRGGRDGREASPVTPVAPVMPAAPNFPSFPVMPGGSSGVTVVPVPGGGMPRSGAPQRELQQPQQPPAPPAPPAPPTPNPPGGRSGNETPGERQRGSDGDRFRSAPPPAAPVLPVLPVLPQPRATGAPTPIAPAAAAPVIRVPVLPQAEAARPAAAVGQERPRDEERKRRPESAPGMRQRENLR